VAALCSSIEIMKLNKGDKVVVITGKDKGKTGTISEVLREVNRVVVEGVNSRTKTHKSKQAGKPGTIVEFSAPLNASNVAIVDPKDGKPSRISMKMIGDKKVRIATKSGAELK
jgi:large subunit ribosomal protein L24